MTEDSIFFATPKFAKQFHQKKKSPSKQWHFSGKLLVVCKTKKKRRCAFANPLQEFKKLQKKKILLPSSEISYRVQEIYS